MDDNRQRILEATYACVARWGMAKTTVEDAAREAKVSRATVYRTFPGGRDELINAVVNWATLEFFVRLYEQVQGADSLETVMERGIMFAHRSIVEHEVLQRVMQTEPDKLLPALTVESNRIRRGIAEFLVPYLDQRGVAAGRRSRRGGRLPGPDGALLHVRPRALGPGRSGPGGPAGAGRAAGRGGGRPEPDAHRGRGGPGRASLTMRQNPT